MTTWGGREVVTAAVTGAVLAGSGALLAGCTETADEARSVQSRLGRVDGVTRVEVTTPSGERGAAFTIAYDADDIDDPASLAALVGAVDRIAVDEGYAPYRLTFTAAGDGDHVLTVDDSFAGSEAEVAALRIWFEVAAAMIGSLSYDVEGGWETLAVDSGGGIAHDVGEARRIGYGGPTTRWSFRNGATSFVVGGSVSARDEALLADVQSDVGSAGLPAPAAGWRLGRYAGHVRLDVDLDPVASPARLTVGDYGRQVAPLATAALEALRRTGLRRFLSLDQGADAERPDVFATWASTQEPAPGRDRLDRGWDPWLERLARS